MTRRTPDGLKPQSKRERLAAAVRNECLPLLFEMGFRNPKKADRDRWEASRPFVFGRWRGHDYDHVEIRWDLYGRPKFWIGFLARRFEPPKEAGGAPTWRLLSGDIYTWRIGLWGGRVVAGQTFGNGSISRSIEMAKRRLEEVNEFLLSGVARPHIGVWIDLPGYVPGSDPVGEPMFWSGNVQPSEMEEPKLRRRRPSAASRGSQA
jgi:hypothetical protein